MAYIIMPVNLQCNMVCQKKTMYAKKLRVASLFDYMKPQHI